MGNVSLLFGGVALFLNSLSLFGKVDLKSAGLFSLLTGLLQTFIATWLVIGAAGDPALTFGYASIYLFAFTYLYVGITFLFGLDGSGVGWFSLFVAISALFYAGVSFSTGDFIGWCDVVILGHPVGIIFPRDGIKHQHRCADGTGCDRPQLADADRSGSRRTAVRDERCQLPAHLECSRHHDGLVLHLCGR